MSNPKWEESVRLSPPYSGKPTPGLREKVEAAVKKANADLDKAQHYPAKAALWDQIRSAADESEIYKALDDSELLDMLLWRLL